MDTCLEAQKPPRNINSALMTICYAVLGLKLVLYLTTNLLGNFSERSALIALGGSVLIILFLISSNRSQAKGACSQLVISEAISFGSMFMSSHFEPELGLVWATMMPLMTFFIQVLLVQDFPHAKLFYQLKPLLSALLFDCLESKGAILTMSSFLSVLCVLSIFLIFLSNNDIDIQSLQLRFAETRHQLNSLFDISSDGLFILTSQGKVVKANKPCLAALKVSSPSEVCEIISSLKYKEGTNRYYCSDYAECEADLFHFLNSDDEDSAVLGELSIDGRTFMWVAHKVSWESNPALIVLMKEITALIELERVKVESSFKNVMLRSVSHELRTPTSGIMHTVVSLASSDDVPAWAKQKLEVSGVCCKHLLLLINDLLDYSQIIAGKFKLSLRHFQLRKCLKEAVEIMRMIAESKSLNLVLHIDPLLPQMVYSDENRLCQVLMNLLSNAIKFTQKGGRVELKATLNETGMMEISITDTGIGISTRDIHNLFTLFGKLDLSSSMNPQGVGLGLHISNKLAQELGNAQIHVQSTIDVGSCFSFCVNIFESQRLVPVMGSIEFSESSAENAGAQEVYKFIVDNDHSARLLVVDDCHFNRLVIVDILKTIHVQCDECDSGADAIDIVVKKAERGKPYQIILMDYEMPGLSGPATCRTMLQQLRELGLPLPKVIAYSAYDSEDDAKQCVESGMIDFLPKPSSRDKIISTLERHFKH
mmetsp:Transcript_7357/g.13630  ORF Transcript_7357/g.13630 Transcript_7357/m.13630 type:complete len:708 (-) Transcript_7357:1588-3711(-)